MFDSFHYSRSRLFTFHRSVYAFALLTAVRIALVQWPLLGLISFPFFRARVKSLFVSSPIQCMSFLTEEACWPTLLAKRGNWFRMYRWHFRSSTFIAWRPPRCFSSLPIFKFLFFFILIFYSRFSNFASIILYFHSVISLILYILRLIHIGSFIICKTLWLLKYASNMH